VPAIAVTAETGAALAGGDRVRVAVDASSSFDDEQSVIASRPDEGGDVVMLGAHLDSVVDGPGINDNGSGVAVLLELARWLAEARPGAPVRFAFWAGEEAGLYGSRDYVEGLDPSEAGAIRAYVNVDMVGSPNFATFVYDATASDPAGSRRIAALFQEALAAEGFESEPLDLGGASDHAPFEAAGIVTGGLYSGSDEHKTIAQAREYGGTPGEALDPCYHQSCDTVENISPDALRRHALALVAIVTALVTN
jgi:Zn-dependent M28 family amino/carboxypeptidase